MTYRGQGPYRPQRPPHRTPPPPPYAPRVPLRQRLDEDEWPTTRELLARLRGRRGSLAVAVPVLCCLWPVLLPVVAYPLIRSARRGARAVFPVRRRRHRHDPEVLRIQRLRAWLALGASLAILVVYGTAQDWSDLEEQFLLRLLIAPWVLLLTAPLVVGALFLMASAPVRPAMRAGLRPAGRTVLCYFGAFAAVPALVVGAGRFGNDIGAGPAGPLLTLALFVPALWALLFVAFASATVVRTAFDTVEIHPYLPALLAGVLVWQMAVLGLAVDGPPPGPLVVQIGALVAGPLSVTAVAWWEIARLRTRHGVTLRG